MKRDKIILKTALNKQPYLVVKAGNNRTLVVSETYKSRQGVDNAAKALKRVMKHAEVVDRTKKKSK